MDDLTGDLTTSEAAEILGITRHRVVALIRAKRLPARNVAAPEKPAFFLIAKRDLEAFKKIKRKRGNPNWIKGAVLKNGKPQKGRKKSRS